MFRQELETIYNKEHREGFEKTFDKEVEKFVEDLIEKGNYPDKPSDIEIILYQLKGRDVL